MEKLGHIDWGIYKSPSDVDLKSRKKAITERLDYIASRLRAALIAAREDSTPTPDRIDWWSKGIKAEVENAWTYIGMAATGGVHVEIPLIIRATAKGCWKGPKDMEEYRLTLGTKFYQSLKEMDGDNGIHQLNRYTSAWWETPGELHPSIAGCDLDDDLAMYREEVEKELIGSGNCPIPSSPTSPSASTNCQSPACKENFRTMLHEIGDIKEDIFRLQQLLENQLQESTRTSGTYRWLLERCRDLNRPLTEEDLSQMLTGARCRRRYANIWTRYAQSKLRIYLRFTYYVNLGIPGIAPTYGKNMVHSMSYVRKHGMADWGQPIRTELQISAAEDKFGDDPPLSIIWDSLHLDRKATFLSAIEILTSMMSFYPSMYSEFSSQRFVGLSKCPQPGGHAAFESFTYGMRSVDTGTAKIAAYRQRPRNADESRPELISTDISAIHVVTVVFLLEESASSRKKIRKRHEILFDRRISARPLFSGICRDLQLRAELIVTGHEGLELPTGPELSSAKPTTSCVSAIVQNTLPTTLPELAVPERISSHNK
ncbi:hypothetical protein BDZ97DRAFT_1762502 [Flammula alnicola]|nr:hypothetical protein BDZ97DRAFT_1762502 [Flammula alnicola]